MGEDLKIRKKKIKKYQHKSFVEPNKRKAIITENSGILDKIKNVISHFNNDADKIWAI